MFSTKYLRNAEVGDLDVSSIGEKQILKLDVPVRDAVVMEVSNTSKDLFEEANLVFLLQVLALD